VRQAQKPKLSWESSNRSPLTAGAKAPAVTSQRSRDARRAFVEEPHEGF
jgi:hypothetical protein